MPSCYRNVFAALCVLLFAAASGTASAMSIEPQVAQSIDRAILLRKNLIDSARREQAYLPDNPYLRQSAYQAAISRANGDLASAVVATIAAYPAQAKAIVAYARQNAPDAKGTIQAAVSAAFPNLFGASTAGNHAYVMSSPGAAPISARNSRIYADMPPPRAIPLPSSLYNQPALTDYSAGGAGMAVNNDFLTSPQDFSLQDKSSAQSAPAGEYGEADSELAEADIIWDPLEPANVSLFSFNEVADLFFLRPLAQLYSYTPEIVKTGIANALFNLREPVNAANSLLQGEFGETGTTLARFAINSTVGVLGLYDAAANLIGWQKRPNDFGATLHSYGLGAGPYLDLPLIGPSNMRDAVGLVVDAALDPKTYLLTPAANYGIAAAGGLSQREALLEPLDELRRSSLDYYTALQGAYYQRRAAQFSGKSGGDSTTANELFDNFE